MRSARSSFEIRFSLYPQFPLAAAAARSSSSLPLSLSQSRIAVFLHLLLLLSSPHSMQCGSLARSIVPRISHLICPKSSVSLCCAVQTSTSVCGSRCPLLLLFREIRARFDFEAALRMDVSSRSTQTWNSFNNFLSNVGILISLRAAYASYTYCTFPFRELSKCISCSSGCKISI